MAKCQTWILETPDYKPVVGMMMTLLISYTIYDVFVYNI